MMQPTQPNQPCLPAGCTGGGIPVVLELHHLLQVGRRFSPHLPVSLYIWNRVSSYLIYWQLGAKFQIYRELEDEAWWCFHICFFNFFYPYIGEDEPILTIIFFSWVGEKPATRKHNYCTYIVVVLHIDL